MKISKFGTLIAIAPAIIASWGVPWVRSQPIQLAQNSDNFFQECLRNSRNQNQADMNYCAYLDYQQADDTLNQLYQKLRSQLSSTNKELLTDAQLAWISFRDKEWVLSVSTMGRISPGGSMYPGIKSNFYADFTKKRNVELEAYVRGRTLQPNRALLHECCDRNFSSGKKLIGELEFYFVTFWLTILYHTIKYGT
ncbi:lysozyme inhibitor LprI family protein, partial [Okeania sp.]|uniref:lysozyme inhibitor LprI family protein n=1 Tax=Okeania sp. TaxID=3100323 RepID=UPI002B4B2FEB